MVTAAADEQARKHAIAGPEWYDQQIHRHLALVLAEQLVEQFPVKKTHDHQSDRTLHRIEITVLGKP